MKASSHPTAALVLHFRTAASTATCLYSLQAQGLDCALLVDNSEDGGCSLRELDPDLEMLRDRGMRVEVLEPGRNLGFSVGVNRGLAAIRERFGAMRVLLINSDAQLMPNAMPPLHAAIDEGAAIVSPLLESPDGSLKSVAYYHRFSGLLFSRPLLGAFPHLSGCCLLLSDVMAQDDLLDERFFFYGEDAYLGWALAKKGDRAFVVESSRAMHTGSGSSRRGSLFYEYHMARAHLELANALSWGSMDRVGLLLGRSLMLPVRAMWRSFRQCSLAPIRGLALALYDFRLGHIRELTPPQP